MATQFRLGGIDNHEVYIKDHDTWDGYSILQYIDPADFPSDVARAYALRVAHLWECPAVVMDFLLTGEGVSAAYAAANDAAYAAYAAAYAADAAVYAATAANAANAAANAAKALGIADIKEAMVWGYNPQAVAPQAVAEAIASGHTCWECGRPARYEYMHRVGRIEYICRQSSCLSRSSYLLNRERMGLDRDVYTYGVWIRVLLDTDEIVHRDWVDSNAYYGELTRGWYAFEEHRDAMEADRQEDIDRESRENIVYGYHETDVLNQHGWPSVTPKKGLCFGVELEMEHKEEDSSEGQEQLSTLLGGKEGKERSDVPGNYILMRDGSLDSSGVELITAPYTLEYHQDTFGWKTLLDSVKDVGRSGRGTSACGMHVHINRASISALTLGKMLVFVNEVSNTRLIERIAQRNPEQWARRYKKTIRDGISATSDKYEALHVGRQTIECRIFRGNLRPDRVLKNIEFCHSIVVYCKQASMKAVEGHSDYLHWLGKNRGTYPNLVRFLGETYGFKVNKFDTTAER